MLWCPLTEQQVCSLQSRASWCSWSVLNGRLFIKRYTPNMSLRCTIQNKQTTRNSKKFTTPEEVSGGKVHAGGSKDTYAGIYTWLKHAGHIQYHRLENLLKMWQGIEPHETTWKHEHIHTYLWKLSYSKKKRKAVCSVVTFKAVFGLQ